MKNIYNERLIHFANQIEKIENPSEPKFFQVRLMILHKHANAQYIATFPSWIFYQLPNIFPKDWFLTNRGEPNLKNIETSADWIAGVFDYFDLDPTEFCLLFDLKRGYLRGNLMAKRVSFNIKKLVNRKMQ